MTRNLNLTNPPSCDDLLNEFKSSPQPQSGRLLTIENIEDKDGYNPVFIKDNMSDYLAVRIESPNSYWLDPVSYDPKIMFFCQSTNSWVPKSGAPIFDLMEDPFSCWVTDDNGEKVLVLGGVKVDRTSSPPTITTQFFKGKSVIELEHTPFAIIKGMKDIRMVELSDNKTKIICTRPVGGEAGLGTIGFASIQSLSQLNQATIESAQLLKGQVASNVKLGPNELYLISKDGKDWVGVLGHIACNVEEVRHYFATVFLFDPENPLNTPKEFYIPKIIATRENFDTKASGKRLTHNQELNLDDVLFPGSLVKLPNGKMNLYTGVGDAHVGSVEIEDPFK